MAMLRGIGLAIVFMMTFGATAEPGKRRSHLSLVCQLFGARHGWLPKLWFREFQSMSCDSPWCRWYMRSKPFLQPLPAFPSVRAADTATMVITRSQALIEHQSGRQPSPQELKTAQNCRRKCVREGCHAVARSSPRDDRLFSLPAPMRRPDIVQVQCRSNQREVRECLREISDLASRLRIILFSKQADVVAKLQQALEQRRCFGVAVLQHVIVGQPEAAREKYAFTRRQTVVAAGSIAAQKSVEHELRSIAAMVPVTRGSSAAGTRRGISSRLASSSLSP